MTDDDPLATFRLELIRRREGLALTAVDAGKRAGITGQRWSNIERGWESKSGVRIPANPRRATLIKMARAVQWPIAEALTAAGWAAASDHEVRDVMADPMAELVRLTEGLSVPQMWALLYVARSMLDPQALVPTEHDPQVESDRPDDALASGVVHREMVVDTPQEPETTTGLNERSARE